MSCKIFYNSSLDKLEDEINEWLDVDDEDIEIIKMQYLAADESGPHNYLYSVIIIYK